MYEICSCCGKELSYQDDEVFTHSFFSFIPEEIYCSDCFTKLMKDLKLEEEFDRSSLNI